MSHPASPAPADRSAALPAGPSGLGAGDGASRDDGSRDDAGSGGPGGAGAVPADRYGRADSPARRRRANLVGAIVAGLATIGVVAYWASSSLGAGSSTDAQLVNFAVRGDSLVSVNFTVTSTPGTALACAVQAQNDQYLVVGWQVVDVPASDEHTRQLSVDVRTTQPAASIVLKECWAV